MLSLLTYGATLGVAEVASTRHERNPRDSRKGSQEAIDLSNDRSPNRTSTRYPTESLTRHPAEHSTRHSRDIERNRNTERNIERDTEAEYQTDPLLKHQSQNSPPAPEEFPAKHQFHQEQHATKGGVRGWLRRLIQHQT